MELGTVKLLGALAAILGAIVSLFSSITAFMFVLRGSSFIWPLVEFSFVVSLVGLLVLVLRLFAVKGLSELTGHPRAFLYYLITFSLAVVSWFIGVFLPRFAGSEFIFHNLLYLNVFHFSLGIVGGVFLLLAYSCFSSSTGIGSFRLAALIYLAANFFISVLYLPSLVFFVGSLFEMMAYLSLPGKLEGPGEVVF